MAEPIRWFRMYGEAVDDEKLRLLAFEDRWHFFALLCCKAQGLLDGDDALIRRKVAVKMGLAIRELDEVARRLAEVGLIDAETLQPCAWDRRQFKADDSKERVRAYRERMKRDVTVTVTAQETDTETETDTDTEKEEKIERARSPRGARLPSDFPTVECLDWCKQERPDLDAARLRDKFRDYWIGVPGARGRKADWPATWRNFVRSEFVPQARAAPKESKYKHVFDGLTGRSNQPQEFIDVIATEKRRIG